MVEFGIGFSLMHEPSMASAKVCNECNIWYF
ncbi:hypothetical protein HEHE104102_07790 [Helicobacter hepaticus]